METKKYTPEEVVKEDLLFSIPIYQRLFTWGHEQVYGLLKDMQEHFQSNEFNDTRSPYYLGMLSCIENNGGRFDLIDGQQRFTIITLMGIVFRCHYSEWNNFLSEGKRINFVARPKDKEYLISKIANPDPGKKMPESEMNSTMEEAIKCIESFMNCLDEQSKKCYAKNVYHHLAFYFSKLPSEYLADPTSLNKYFEAMNAYGKNLEQHEILKVTLMKDEPEKVYLTKIWNAVSEMRSPVIRRPADEPIENYRKKYEGAISCCRKGEYGNAFQFCSQSIDSENNMTIGDIKPKKMEPNNALSNEEDRSIISFPAFLLMVLDIYQSIDGGYSYYRKDLISTFKQHQPSDIKGFYHSLLFYRLMLDYYVITKENSLLANKYKILYAETSDSSDDSLSKESVIRYQSMLYVSQTPIYEWLKPLLLKISKQRPDGYSQILKWLKATDNSHRILPKKEDMSYDKIDRYWFWRLDYYLWEKQNDYFPNAEDREIVNEYVFRANRSIEHLHPRSQTQNSKWEDQDIDSFGNLAMISQSFNSEQSDDPVTVKFARINEQAKNHNLQSLKLYRMYLDAEKAPGGWTLEKKKDHQDMMWQLLQDSFPKEQ